MDNKSIIKNLEPNAVFNYFADICDIPHGSGNTKKISDYVVDFAKKNNLEVVQDEFNNVIVIKRSKNPVKSAIALQGHIDMVCAKNQGTSKDMKKEGIEIVLNDNFLSARDTSLGADNGIGVAISLTILSDGKDYDRDIVGIFTIDEETSMVGASKINLNNINVANLINIDNEEYDVINVGCASGSHLEYNKKFNLINESDKKLISLDVSGCFGGHSAIEITRKGANAIKTNIELLANVIKKYDINLIDINGGEVDNAIPIKCTSKILVDKKISDNFIEDINKQIELIKEKCNNTDPDIKITIDAKDVNEVKCYSKDDTNIIIKMFDELPNGLVDMFEGFQNVAETSLNLGVVKAIDNDISFIYLIRSNINNKKEMLVKKIREISKKNGFIEKKESSFPAWEYEKNTNIEKEILNSYKKLYKETPRIEITHGGLECGMLKQKMPNTNFIAIGPNIYGIHTTKEKVDIESVNKIYNIIIETIKSIK